MYSKFNGGIGMNNILENAYNNYFSDVNFDNRKEKQFTQETIPVKPNKSRLTADGNIGDIDQLGEILRTITNAAWGNDWGELKPDISMDSTLNTLKLPLITYDVNSREVSDKMPIKPVLSDTIQEIVDGKPTGDVIMVYRQFFDCIVEFNTWGRNSLEARKIMNDLETLLNSYGGYLKRLGISEMFFLKEIPSNKSVNYIPGIPMRSMMYFVRLEKIHQVRDSIIKNIDIQVQAYLDKKFGIEQQPVDIYKNNNINYNL